MPKIIRISAGVLLLGALATMVLVVRQYRWGRSGMESSYTSDVKKRDIIDAARNAFGALTDAELRAEGYALTGETIYSESFSKDLRDWEDESGTLEVIAENDPAAPMARELRKAGKQTMDELSAVVALYDKAGRDPALDRIRKTSSIVYLDKTRELVKQIVDADGDGTESGRPLMLRGTSMVIRLTEYAVGLFVMALAAIILVFAAARSARS
jgi:CHASE3 domain sensor protein